MAKLYFRYGAMNSAKSASLLLTAHNYEEQNMKVVLVKPSKDTKGADKIVSRVGIERKVDILLKPNEDVSKIIMDKYADADCILVDEAEFLEPKQVDELMGVVLEMDIPVICYGLRTDFLTHGFPGAIRLLEIAHSIEELKTVCKCGQKAIFNARFSNGKFTLEGDQVAIDGKDNITYMSMCGKCYRLEKNKLAKK
jgi:thymidine kinase